MYLNNKPEDFLAFYTGSAESVSGVLLSGACSCACDCVN